MKYDNPELLEYLASEYVLGTLRGKARLRFERLQMQSYRARQKVWEWEQRIYPMCESIDDIEPNKEVWNKIQQRIHGNTKSESGSFWHSLFVWKAFGGGVTLAAMMLAAVMFIPGFISQNTLSEDYVSIFNSNEAEPVWVISADLQTGELRVRAVNADAAEIGKAFELWMLPDGDNPPKSLGLMPVADNTQKIVLNPTLIELLRQSKGMAVSVEPEGGSPTGTPTGPVIYTADFIAL